MENNVINNFVEFEPVVLLCDLLEHGLVAGDVGMVQDISESGKQVGVEFVGYDEAVVAEVTLSVTQVRSFRKGDFPHVRPR